MGRRGSGMKKIVKEHKYFEKFPGYKAPEFKSNSGEFHVTLWNLNYDEKQFANSEKQFANDTKEFANEKKETAKEVKQRKEFVKAKRAIYKLITSNPKVTTAQIAVVYPRTISPEPQKYDFWVKVILHIIVFL